ncbi:MAG: N-acetylmuramoyl-L-alanine amidase, partial [Bacteroidetes bacterium]|nr:N-acetylmuramoyl-L-alanine amidase [Bacteroidota bacterium]
FPDKSVDLKERSVMANNSGADVFISIHHNAPGKADDHSTDYTSTYYHARDTNYEYEPCNYDLAKYIQRDLAYAMRNSGGPGSFDGTYSDYWIYPGMGFSVLRLTKLPAVLVECGFNTQHFEAQRLILEDFNKIEAWGIFRGICRYFSSGVPTISAVSADSIFNTDSLNLPFQIKDSTGIDPSSIKVEFDSVTVSDKSFDPSSGILNFQLSMLQKDPNDLSEGKHVIRIMASNKNGNHSFPFYKKIKVVKKI